MYQDSELGVFATTYFKPFHNARLAVSRGRARLFHIRRGFVVMTKKACLLSYLSVVRAILEDAIQAVSLCVKNDIAPKDRLHKLPTRLVKNFWRFPYERNTGSTVVGPSPITCGRDVGV